MLFEDDWPANLEGISRALRRIRHSDFHNHNIECNIVDNIREINVLKDRMAHLGWFAPPNAAETSTWSQAGGVALGEGGHPGYGDGGRCREALFEALPAFSARFRRNTSPGVWIPANCCCPRTLKDPAPSSRPSSSFGSSPESFVREAVLPGVGINSEAREGQVARFLDFVTRGSIFGTDVPALQAGLAIDPVAVARVFARSNQPEPRRSPAIPVWPLSPHRLPPRTSRPTAS